MVGYQFANSGTFITGILGSLLMIGYVSAQSCSPPVGTFLTGHSTNTWPCPSVEKGPPPRYVDPGFVACALTGGGSCINDYTSDGKRKDANQPSESSTLAPAPSSETVTANPSSASNGSQSEFTGDLKMSCEALLCLSVLGGSSPGECEPSLAVYFRIRGRTTALTDQMRAAFLAMCPISTETALDFKSNSKQSSNRCSALNINIANTDANETIINALPSQCINEMYGNSPVYIGTPSTGGFWVDKNDYANGLKAYNETKK